ncbi:unnamed protein product, partial [Gulo gulo]
EESQFLRLYALLKLQHLQHVYLSFLSHPSLEQKAYRIVEGQPFGPGKAQAGAAVLPERATQEMETLDTNASRDQQVCKFSEDYKQIYLSLTYSIILILGLPLNGTVLWLSWRQTKPWSCATIYLVNLMVADLLYVLTLPFLIITYSLGD